VPVSRRPSTSDEQRRRELLQAAASEISVLGGDDPEAYFNERKARRLRRCAASDRPLWESITWGEARLERDRWEAFLEELPSRLLDRKRLMAEYGFTGSSADRLIRRDDVRTVHLPGERKTYVLREDIERIVADNTFDKTKVRPTTGG
jgi:hypothetical protein